MKKNSPLIRADEWLVLNHLAETRSKAQAMILSHSVRLSKDNVIDKPSRKIPIDALLKIDAAPQFVSRGGEKLAGFLGRFPMEIEGKDILDIGASTGGFTDCLLQRGALSAVCVDVGHGQLHYKLRKDPRVSNFENVNARDLTPNFFQGRLFGIVVCDVSFISLKKIFPVIWPFVAQEGYLIALIKPQFEAEKNYMDRCKGVIRDPKIQENICDDMVRFAANNLCPSQCIGIIDSPILGAEGNREFLLGLRKK
ncbi:MAG: TlyA family RNA methyltransferase [Puniceicoccales bacterium]|jgi:23S rRNA (cytidine1920-2'-O)/16S rRNA (cytidine1409-2'-O)-methyltransferase|nr:TlyA family RNA methyltransferase [Puniceicoccales bacterium]